MVVFFAAGVAVGVGDGSGDGVTTGAGASWLNFT